MLGDVVIGFAPLEPVNGYEKILGTGAVGHKYNVPEEKVAVFSIDTVSVEVFWPETMVAPKPTPAPAIYQPLQLAGELPDNASVYVLIVQVAAAVTWTLVGERIRIPDTPPAKLLFDSTRFFVPWPERTCVPSVMPLPKTYQL